jgi:hypothetical protein
MRKRTEDEFKALISRLTNSAASQIRQIAREVALRPELMTSDHQTRVIGYLQTALTETDNTLTALVGSRQSVIQGFDLETYEPPAEVPIPPASRPRQPVTASVGLPAGAKLYDPNASSKSAESDDFGVGFVDLPAEG